MYLYLYEGAKTRIKVDSELSEEFEVEVAMQQGSVQSPVLFAVVVDVADYQRVCIKLAAVC